MRAVAEARLAAEKQFGPDSALAQALKLRAEQRRLNPPVDQSTCPHIDWSHSYQGASCRRCGFFTSD